MNIEEIKKNAPDGAEYYRDMHSICHPNEILYYAWFGGALLTYDFDLKEWIKSIYHEGHEYIIDQLKPL